MTEQVTYLEESIISNPYVLAEEILQNEYFGGSLTLPVEDENSTANAPSYVMKTIPFYLTGNFSFGLGNNWKDLFDFNSTFFSDLYNLISMGFNKNNPQITLQSKFYSGASWQGSKRPNFKIDTIFVATNRKYNPLKILKRLSRACLPTKTTDGTSLENLKEEVRGYAEKLKSYTTNQTIDEIVDKIVAGIQQTGMQAPLGYGLQQSTSDDNIFGTLPNTTLSLRIGNWFQCSDLLIENLGNIELSKEVVAPFAETNSGGSQDLYRGYSAYADCEDYGFPLYMKCSIEFRTAFMLMADEFAECFITNTGTQQSVLSSSTNVLDTENIVTTEGKS